MSTKPAPQLFCASSSSILPPQAALLLLEPCSTFTEVMHTFERLDNLVLTGQASITEIATWGILDRQFTSEARGQWWCQWLPLMRFSGGGNWVHSAVGLLPHASQLQVDLLALSVDPGPPAYPSLSLSTPSVAATALSLAVSYLPSHLSPASEPSSPPPYAESFPVLSHSQSLCDIQFPVPSQAEVHAKPSSKAAKQKRSLTSKMPGPSAPSSSAPSLPTSSATLSLPTPPTARSRRRKQPRRMQDKCECGDAYRGRVDLFTSLFCLAAYVIRNSEGLEAERLLIERLDRGRLAL